MRCPAHSDVGSLTFLIQDDGAEGDGRHPGGLQILIDGGWHDLAPEPGTILMNVGETLRRWTNDRWTASKHRVVNPPPGQAHTARLSLGFFQKPNFWARMDPIPGTETAGPGLHAGILAGQYMRQRMLHSVGHQSLEPLLRDEAATAVKQVALA
jgi:isopenicillin N synthase-like dioxygenase